MAKVDYRELILKRLKAADKMRHFSGMAVDYYTLPCKAFEDKYPQRPPEPAEEGGCWTTELAKAVAEYDATK